MNIVIEDKNTMATTQKPVNQKTGLAHKAHKTYLTYSTVVLTWVKRHDDVIVRSLGSILVLLLGGFVAVDSITVDRLNQRVEHLETQVRTLQAHKQEYGKSQTCQ